METKDEVSEVIAADIPVLEDFLKTMLDEANSITEVIETLLKRVQENEFQTKDGISLLDVKYLSALSYIIDIILLVRMKIQGESIANCQAKHRIVENRTVLEKIQPLEHKMKYQIDKLLRQSTNLLQNDPLALKPNIDDLENKLEDTTEEVNTEDEPKIYVPPQIAALHYDEDEERKEKHMERARERALKKSSIISELAQETSDAPLEISEYSSGKKRVQKERSERSRFEEANFMRINLTKKQKNAEKRYMQQSELNTIAKFGDISVLDDAGGQSQSNEMKRKKFSGKYKPGKKWKKFRK